MSIAYPRKKLDAAEPKQLSRVLNYLLILEEKIHVYKNPHVFPGIKSLKDYALLGLKGTKEQIMHANAREAVRAFWRERPELLRKVKKVVKK